MNARKRVGKTVKRENRITMISDSAFDRLQNLRYIYLEGFSY